MQKIRTFFRVSFFSTVNFLIRNKQILALFNYIYERSPHTFVNSVNQHILIHVNKFDWKIRLFNNKEILTRIQKSEPRSLDVALGYRWHDRGLNMLENVVVSHFEANHKDDSIFIDCGANMGMRSLTALSEGLKVVMIEPNPSTIKMNRDRCGLNSFDNYSILPFGVSDSDEKKEFFIDSSSYLSTFDKSVADADNFNQISHQSMDVRKLDTLFSELLNSKTTAYIKIDVEGHEKEALLGAAKLIKSISPTFLIEINEKSDHIQSIFDDMRAFGYFIYEKTDPDLDKKFLVACPHNMEGYRFNSNDFLFVKGTEMMDVFSDHIRA